MGVDISTSSLMTEFCISYDIAKKISPRGRSKTLIKNYPLVECWDYPEEPWASEKLAFIDSKLFEVSFYSSGVGLCSDWGVNIFKVETENERRERILNFIKNA